MQRRSTTDKVFEYWQLSYTHKMKSKTDYVRQDMVKTTQVQVKEFKRFKKLIDEWIDLAISRLNSWRKIPKIRRRTPDSQVLNPTIIKV